MCSRLLLTVCALTTVFQLHAQDTLPLPAIEILSSKIKFSHTGKKIELFDSIQRQNSANATVAELLANNSTIFVKQYGPGGIASTALRGGSAYHTGMVWQGFNIQNNMLGQTDLTLLSSILFDDIKVEFGGSSAVWGSGAVAGTIYLDNNPEFRKGLTTRINVSGGSFSKFNSGVHVNYSTARFISSTRAYLQNSRNDFSYFDSLDQKEPYKRQINAAYSFNGLMQNFKFLLNSKNNIETSVWYNRGDREIPVQSKNSLSRPLQHDLNFKAGLTWNFYQGKYSAATRTAFFQDHLNYTDSALRIFSKSLLYTFIAENTQQYKISNKAVLQGGINFNSARGQSNNYKKPSSLHRLALFAGSRFSFFDDRLMFLSILRAESISTGRLPVTGNTAAEYFLTKNILLKANMAKVYRQPTLNELYWQPGGREDLLPEQGYTYEGDVSYIKQINHFALTISASAFNRRISNWVLWIPGPRGATPMNIQKVWSRGTETDTKIQFSKNKIFIEERFKTSYVLSTVVHSAQENGNTQGKQLPYTPRYLFTNVFTVRLYAFSFQATSQYTGYRFTASDNLQYLQPYFYHAVRLSYSGKTGNTNLIFFSSINNILNANYALVAGRPMPMRNYEIGLTISAIKKINKPNNNPKND